jgi:hypothetical protein
MRPVEEWATIVHHEHLAVVSAAPNDGTAYEVLVFDPGVVPTIDPECVFVVVTKPHQACAPVRSGGAGYLAEDYVHVKLCPPDYSIWSARVLTALLGAVLDRPVIIDERWLATCDL